MPVRTKIILFLLRISPEFRRTAGPWFGRIYLCRVHLRLIRQMLDAMELSPITELTSRVGNLRDALEIVNGCLGQIDADFERAAGRNG
jgi:hypothetical protein